MWFFKDMMTRRAASKEAADQAAQLRKEEHALKKVFHNVATITMQVRNPDWRDGMRPSRICRPLDG